MAIEKIMNEHVFQYYTLDVNFATLHFFYQIHTSIPHVNTHSLLEELSFNKTYEITKHFVFKQNWCSIRFHTIVISAVFRRLDSIIFSLMFEHNLVRHLGDKSNINGFKKTPPEPQTPKRQCTVM